MPLSFFTSRLSSLAGFFSLSVFLYLFFSIHLKALHQNGILLFNQEWLQMKSALLAPLLLFFLFMIPLGFHFIHFFISSFSTVYNRSSFSVLWFSHRLAAVSAFMFLVFYFVFLFKNYFFSDLVFDYLSVVGQMESAWKAFIVSIFILMLSAYYLFLIRSMIIDWGLSTNQSSQKKWELALVFVFLAIVFLVFLIGFQFHYHYHEAPFLMSKLAELLKNILFF